jgi:hypothetical protein
MSGLHIEGHGISAKLPGGWEGAIRRRLPVLGATAEAAAAATVTGAPPSGEDSLPTAHLATVALPKDRGDFGSGAVELLGREDAFVALLEYGPECVGTAMFPASGIPRTPTAAWFNRRALQRTLDGQTGFQRFFSHRGRAFCLYVVLGRDSGIDPVIGRVRSALGGIAVAPR